MLSKYYEEMLTRIFPPFVLSVRQISFRIFFFTSSTMLCHDKYSFIIRNGIFLVFDQLPLPPRPINRRNRGLNEQLSRKRYRIATCRLFCARWNPSRGGKGTSIAKKLAEMLVENNHRQRQQSLQMSSHATVYLSALFRRATLILFKKTIPEATVISFNVHSQQFLIEYSPRFSASIGYLNLDVYSPRRRPNFPIRISIHAAQHQPH